MNGFHAQGPKIYTRRGDGGQSRLLTGETVEKDDLRLKAYGSLDELQAHLGFARSLVTHERVSNMIRFLQNDIFRASSELASASGGGTRLERIGPEDVARLEEWIDDFVDRYGLPDRFVAPGLFPQSAALHVARTVCRRSERIIVTLNRKVSGYGRLLAFFNRMSDLLFVMAWTVDVTGLIHRVLEELAGAARGSPGGGS